jgi:hypothetical protein
MVHSSSQAILSVAGRVMRLVFTLQHLSLASLLFAPDIVQGDIIFESGTLGPTGIPSEDVFSPNPVVQGVNVHGSVFNGVRFELTQPVKTTEVGGHFVISSEISPGSPGTFFGAIVQLDDDSDFPDSDDLSTSDVVAATTLVFPDPSNEVVGNLIALLEPGWYALVFGSGLFGTEGAGAALLNNIDLGTPYYVGFQSRFGWGERDSRSGERVFVNGVVIPEPASMVLSALISLVTLCGRIRT